MTESDYFDAVLVGDGIAISMSGNVAATLAHLAARLIDHLESGGNTKIDRHMFPNAYDTLAESQRFRARHAPALRDSNPPRRVHARCAAGTTHVINHAEVDDWLVTLGLARFLDHHRDNHDDLALTWLNHMQECLVAALDPQLTGLVPPPYTGPRTIRRR